jgi:multidrug efflux pump subunit AcrB
MALTISTGFVVDDAIVVAENVTRHIEMGKPPFQAALVGAKEIGFTIISISVSLLAVFIPILLMGGPIGRLFREFAVTLSIAIVVSAVLSLTLTPMMCARMLGRDHGKQPGPTARGLEAVLSAVTNAYGRGLDFVLRHQRWTLLFTGATVALTVALYIYVPKGLFPQQDTGTVSGFTEAPQDVSFPVMRARQEKINEIVAADKDVHHFVSFIGGGSGATNTGTLFMELNPAPPRKASSDDVINRLRPKTAKVQGIRLFLQAAQDVRTGGRGSRTQYQYSLQSADLGELKTWAPKVLEKLRQLPELKDVATDQQTAGLKLEVMIDRDTAGRLGVTPQAIDDTLYDAFGQRQIATTYTQLNQYRVVLEVSPEYQISPESLNFLYVRSQSGALVPLSAMTYAQTGAASLSINHQGQFPCVTLSFNLAPGVALGPAVDAIHRAEHQIGLPPSIRADFQGTAQAFRDSLKSQPFLILAALITVYLVLGVLYESLVHPITILSTLPSAGVGALLALLVFRTELSIIALIGIILLIGIVKKNAIMMIDFAIETRRTHGVDAVTAIREACLMRFRPIMMTTMAALFGGVPLALAHGAGSELRQPLGITIVGGLLVSQMLTLFTTPVTYLALDRWTQRKRAEGPAIVASSATPEPT